MIHTKVECTRPNLAPEMVRAGEEKKPCVFSEFLKSTALEVKLKLVLARLLGG